MLESLSRSSILRPKLCDGTDAARGVLASIVFIGHVAKFFSAISWGLMWRQISPFFSFSQSADLSSPAALPGILDQVTLLI